MPSAALPVVYALCLWWISTGVILVMVGLARSTFRASLLIASLICAWAVWYLWLTRDDDSVAAAYIAFTSAVVVWGWHEMSFLMGVITGSRRTPCPPEADGLLRAVYATQVIIYHELAIAATVLALAWLTAGGSNQVGLWTLLVLWGMRISAKLNVFLGVPNLAKDWLPPELTYVATYFRKRPMNLLFPVSVTAATLATVAVATLASGAQTLPGHAVGWTLLASLMALAVFEHWMLVIPIPVAAIWAWGLAVRARQPQPSSVPMPHVPLDDHLRSKRATLSTP